MAFIKAIAHSGEIDWTSLPKHSSWYVTRTYKE